MLGRYPVRRSISNTYLISRVRFFIIFLCFLFYFPRLQLINLVFIGTPHSPCNWEASILMIIWISVWSNEVSSYLASDLFYNSVKAKRGECKTPRLVKSVKSFMLCVLHYHCYFDALDLEKG